MAVSRLRRVVSMASKASGRPSLSPNDLCHLKNVEGSFRGPQVSVSRRMSVPLTHPGSWDVTMYHTCTHTRRSRT
jgi:hypothetical protein